MTPKCTCKISCNLFGHSVINQCPLCLAAPNMFEALEKLYINYPANTATYKIAKKAISFAEAKHQEHDADVK